MDCRWLRNTSHVSWDSPNCVTRAVSQCHWSGSWGPWWGHLGWARPQGLKAFTHKPGILMETARKPSSAGPLSLSRESQGLPLWSLPRPKLPVLFKARPGVNRVSLLPFP